MSQGWQGPPGPPQYPQQQGPYPQQAPYGGQAPYGMQAPPPRSSGGTVIAVVLILVFLVVPVFAVMAIYGVRKYIASAKSAEAKNTVMAIAREAAATYENEPHHLCGSAVAVPATVPTGAKFLPGVGAYETGSETDGWKCLHHAASSPSYFQYEYRAGGHYKGTDRGAPDPGPDGFEASAEGDLDGDGVTSLFVVTGKIDKASHELVIDKQIFVSKEFE